MNIFYKFEKFFLYTLLTLCFSPIFLTPSYSSDTDTIIIDEAKPDIIRQFELLEKEFPDTSNTHQSAQIKPLITHISPLYFVSHTDNVVDKEEKWLFFLQTIQNLSPFLKETSLTNATLFPFMHNFLCISEENFHLAQRVPFFNPKELWDVETTWDYITVLENIGIDAEKGYTKTQLMHAKMLLDYNLPHTHKSCDVITYLTKCRRELSKENIEKYIIFSVNCERYGEPNLYRSNQWNEEDAETLINFNLPLIAKNLMLIQLLKQINKTISIENIKIMEKVRKYIERTSKTSSLLSTSITWELYAIEKEITPTIRDHSCTLIQHKIPITPTNLSHFDHITNSLAQIYGPVAFNRSPHLKMAFQLHEHNLEITKNNLLYGQICCDLDIPLTQININGLMIVREQLAAINLYYAPPFHETPAEKFLKEAMVFHQLGVDIITAQDLERNILTYWHLQKFNIPITLENIEIGRNALDLFIKHNLWPHSPYVWMLQKSLINFILMLPNVLPVAYCYDFFPLFHFMQAGFSLREDNKIFSIDSHQWELKKLSTFFSVINLLIDFEMPITSHNITGIISITNNIPLHLYANKTFVYIKIIQKKQKIKNNIENNHSIEHLLYTKLEITNDRVSIFYKILLEHMTKISESDRNNGYFFSFHLAQTCLYNLYLLENNLPKTPENMALAEKLCPPAYFFNFEGLPWKNGHLKGFSFT